MLLGQDLRGSHKGSLGPVQGGEVEGVGGHHGFTRAHVPLEEAGHLPGALHVLGDLRHNPFLGPGQGEGKGFLEGFRPGFLHLKASAQDQPPGVQEGF